MARSLMLRDDFHGLIADKKILCHTTRFCAGLVVLVFGFLFLAAPTPLYAEQLI